MVAQGKLNRSAAKVGAALGCECPKVIVRAESLVHNRSVTEDEVNPRIASVTCR